MLIPKQIISKYFVIFCRILVEIIKISGWIIVWELLQNWGLLLRIYKISYRINSIKWKILNVKLNVWLNLVNKDRINCFNLEILSRMLSQVWKFLRWNTIDFLDKSDRWEKKFNELNSIKLRLIQLDKKFKDKSIILKLLFDS